MRFPDIILTDIRHAVRSAYRSPGFFVLATLILAVGFGMSMAIASSSSGTPNAGAW